MIPLENKRRVAKIANQAGSRSGVTLRAPAHFPNPMPFFSSAKLGALCSPDPACLPADEFGGRPRPRNDADLRLPRRRERNYRNATSRRTDRAIGSVLAGPTLNREIYMLRLRTPPAAAVSGGRMLCRPSRVPTESHSRRETSYMDNRGRRANYCARVPILNTTDWLDQTAQP
jgi:hypothetical protein